MHLLPSALDGRSFQACLRKLERRQFQLQIEAVRPPAEIRWMGGNSATGQAKLSRKFGQNGRFICLKGRHLLQDPQSRLLIAARLERIQPTTLCRQPMFCAAGLDAACGGMGRWEISAIDGDTGKPQERINLTRLKGMGRLSVTDGRRVITARQFQITERHHQPVCQRARRESGMGFAEPASPPQFTRQVDCAGFEEGIAVKPGPERSHRGVARGCSAMDLPAVVPCGRLVPWVDRREPIDHDMSLGKITDPPK
jgi:hypothetical protein